MFIWSIRIVCQRGQDLYDFCISKKCCLINWSPSSSITWLISCSNDICLHQSQKIILVKRTGITGKIGFFLIHFQFPSQIQSNIFVHVRCFYQFNGFCPILMVLLREPSLCQFPQPEWWVVQYYVQWLIYAFANFQFLIFQIPKDIFSQM